MLAKICRNKEKKLHLPLTAWLSYLLIISLIFSGISLARYTASTSDADTARIATFSVSATEKADQQKLLVLDSAEGISGEYEFEVQNDSKVAVKYTVIVNNLPADVTVSLGTQTVTSNTESSKAEFDAINLGVGNTDTCTLKFTALDDAKLGTYEGIAIDVQFEQID